MAKSCDSKKRKKGSKESKCEIEQTKEIKSCSK